MANAQALSTHGWALAGGDTHFLALLGWVAGAGADITGPSPIFTNVTVRPVFEDVTVRDEPDEGTVRPVFEVVSQR